MAIVEVLEPAMLLGTSPGSLFSRTLMQLTITVQILPSLLNYMFHEGKTRGYTVLFTVVFPTISIESNMYSMSNIFLWINK